MKKNTIMKIVCGIMSAFMIAAAVPSHAVEDTVQEGDSPAAATFDEEYINPGYTKWVRDGRKGPMPPLQDMSYLSESYMNMPSPYALLPEEYDLRDHGLVEPVYDQGEYSDCWAVAAAGAAASPMLGQFPQLSFSPIHTAWFTYRGKDEEEASYYKDPYEAGGFNVQAAGTMAAWKGPVYLDAVTEDPYRDGNPPESMRFRADYHLQDSYYLPAGSYSEGEYFGGDRDITKKIIMETGPVSVKFKSDEASLNEDTAAWYNSKWDYSDHQVIIVGWDDNYPRTNFLKGRRPSKDGAWLARNSWGTYWGDDGYFWLSYEDKTTGISSAYVLEDKDNYSRNYQYDITGWTYSIAPDRKSGENKSGTAANIFRAESDEMLEAVSFYTTDTGTDYDISVYTGVEKGKPQSGVKALQQSGGEFFAGYHTIELDEPVKLEKDKDFSIVVTLKNQEYPLAVPVEMRTDYGKKPPVHMGNGGESYIIANGKWKDAAGFMDDFYITNVCIKGFTNPLPESGEAVPAVRFTEHEGPVADGTVLELEANGADEIYTSLNGTDYKLSSGVMKLDLPVADDSVTVYAYAVRNGAKGNVTEKTFTKARAELSDLEVRTEMINHYDTADKKERYIFLGSTEDEISLSAQSCDKIYVNGEELASSEWTAAVEVPDGGEKAFDIKVKGDGKEDSEYRIIAYRDIVKIDWDKETISFDESRYKVTASDGSTLSSGDSLKRFADGGKEIELTVTAVSGGTYDIHLDPRPEIDSIPINYKAETTLYGYPGRYVYSKEPDMSDSVECDREEIPLVPGEDLYFMITASAPEMSFRGKVFHLEVPDRPAAPEMKTEKITGDSVRFEKEAGAVYSIDGKKWTSDPHFRNLKPSTEYTFRMRIKASEKYFASEISELKITTADSSGAVPGEISRPEDGGSSGNSGSSGSGGAGTGDTSVPYILAAVMGVALAVITFIFIERRKK